MKIQDCSEVFRALGQWIKRRPQLDKADYGLSYHQTPDRKQWWAAYHAYQREIRDIGKDRQRAMKALEEAQRLTPAQPELLADAFRAFSGRLEWDATARDSSGKHPNPHLVYTTGQYFPTEYRKAAASVLETYIASWYRWFSEQNPKLFIYYHLDDVREANYKTGGHWFDRDTMRFFRTKIESPLIAGRYFISSEQCSDSHARFYTVRSAEPDGSVDTIGEFQAYRSRGEARNAIRELLAERSAA